MYKYIIYIFSIFIHLHIYIIILDKYITNLYVVYKCIIIKMNAFTYIRNTHIYFLHGSWADSFMTFMGCCEMTVSVERRMDGPSCALEMYFNVLFPWWVYSWFPDVYKSIELFHRKWWCLDNAKVKMQRYIFMIWKVLEKKTPFFF